MKFRLQYAESIAILNAMYPIFRIKYWELIL